MSRLFSLLFVVLALFSSHVALGAPSCSQGTDCVSKCKHRFGNSITVTPSTYIPNASGVPPSDGGDNYSTPTPTPDSSSGNVSADEINDYLSDHNSVRAAHGANALVWNQTLSDKAQQGANGCVFQHSGGTLGPFGGKCLPSGIIPCLLKDCHTENLAAGTGNYTIDDGVGDWAAEVCKLQYDDCMVQNTR